METQRTKLTKVSINSDLLQLDLMIEILKRLPFKTLIRFLCVSKLWASTIRSEYFKKLFLNVSMSRPKSIVFTFRRKYKYLAYLSVLTKNAHVEYSSSSSSSSACASLATYHVTCCTRQRTAIAPSVHGLICYGPASRLVIYNPCTRRSITLPKIYTRRRPVNQYLGYDPIGGDYKVLCIMRGLSTLKNRRGLAEEIQVLTLGSQSSWRLIQDVIIPPHAPESKELCINGVLYYGALIDAKLNDSAIMSFDVRSEKLALIKGPCRFRSFSKLTSYEGKLAVIFFEKKTSGVIGLWVLEDDSKDEWLKKTFVLPDLAASITNSRFLRSQRLCNTDADTGEIIFTPTSVNASLSSVVYCDPEKNSVRKFNIEGTKEEFISYNEDSVSSCLVENLMFL